MDPKILKMKIWHINEKPVFYGYEEEPSVYSVLDRSIVGAPAHMSMLSRRDVGPKDLSSIIMHNQMSDEDFEILHGKQLIPDDIFIFFRKIQGLKKEVQELRNLTSTPIEKSEEQQPEPIGTPTPAGIAAVIKLIQEGLSGGGTSVFDQIKSGTAGLSENDKKMLDLVASHFGLSSTEELVT